ncbi:MAG: DUF98 domain-containing protein [Pseudomonadales bacterium]|nr:DUF98 domain-containing protein [Pseudomonadales bacterium]
MKSRLDLDEKIERLFSTLTQVGEVGIEPGMVNQALSKLEKSGLEKVPAFLRALLVTDGTVTMALEAYFSESICINTLRQGRLAIPHSLSALEMAKHEECFFREVELLGAESGTCYGHASSILNKKAIDDDLFEQLVDETVGIGVILRNVAKGSFREVLDVGTGNVMVESDLYRTYRVTINSLPAILITEEFSRAVYI